MSSTAPLESDRRRVSLKQKLALASGAGAAVAGLTAAPSAEAGITQIVQSTTLPLTPSATAYATVYWDVDGDGTNDFYLSNEQNRWAQLYSTNGGRFVAGAAATQPPAKLNLGFIVGATMPGFKFFASTQGNLDMTYVGGLGDAAAAGGWTLGDIGYFGFKFTNLSGTHYGWGTLNLHGTSGGYVQGQGFTLTSAYYESTPNAPIQVGDTGGSPSSVPEIDPASAGSVVSLVMGSLAMLERRRLRRAKAADGSTVSA